MRVDPAYAKVQAIAKTVLSQLAPTLTPLDSEFTIAERACSMLVDCGIVETWYYNCPALVLSGSRSRLSISGRDYVPSCEPVGQQNVITVDLSPVLKGAWGDCARTFVMEGRTFTATPAVAEFNHGLREETLLHQAMRKFVSPCTTFADLWEFASQELKQTGFENLDSHGNFGHSIANRLEDRVYIEAGNHAVLSSVAYFTFEPHIRRLNGQWGFKHEDIYYFDDDSQLRVL